MLRVNKSSPPKHSVLQSAQTRTAPQPAKKKIQGRGVSTSTNKPIASKWSFGQKVMVACAIAGSQVLAHFTKLTTIGYLYQDPSFTVSNYLPNAVKQMADDPLYVGQMQKSLAKTLTGNDPFWRIQVHSVALAPLVEEWITRGLVQNVLIKKVQQVLINRFYPNQPELINSVRSKTVRVVLSAAIFGLLHYQNEAKKAITQAGFDYNKVPADKLDLITTLVFSDQRTKDVLMLSSFFSGIFYGAIQEITGSTWACTLAHMANNVVAMHVLPDLIIPPGSR